MEVMEQSELHIDIMQLKKAALVFRAINHKLRQEMLQLIHENQRMTVTRLYVKLRLEQSVASQHLAILRNARMVLTGKEGKFVFYSVNYQRIEQVHLIARQLFEDKTG